MTRIRLLALLGALAPIHAIAADYEVRHDWDLQFNKKPNAVYRGRWSAVATTHARNTSTQANDRTTANTPFTPAATGVINALSDVAGAHADSHAEYSANANGTGFHRVWGTATVSAPLGRRAIAWSRSYIATNIGTVNAKGKIKWKSQWKTDSISGRGAAGHDPLIVRSINLDTDERRIALVWSVDIQGDGAMLSTLVNGDLSFAGLGDGMIRIIAGPSPYITSPTGILEVQYKGGIVTFSAATGMFSAIVVPSLGSGASFTGHIGDPTGQFEFDVDMGDTNINGYDMGVGTDSDGTADAVGTGVPTTIVEGNITTEATAFTSYLPTQWYRFEVRPTSSTTVVDRIPVQVDTVGHYRFRSTILGNVLIKVKAPQSLSETVPAVLNNTGENTLPFMQLRNGDANDDNVVDFFDYLMLSDGFESQLLDEPYTANLGADLTRDLQIDLFDYLIMSNRYEEEGH
ncbi:MAG: hypothetical protein JNM85_10235 [Chthonomonas sp.]|nr:hypothetical protein [Chthonomonas sp.]